MNTPTKNPNYVVNDMAEFISRRMREISASMNCCLPGTIQSFNATNQTVTAIVNFQKIIKGVLPIPNSSLMADQVINYPLLVNVPIIFLQGGSAYLTFPIAKGDQCLLFFCDRDMDVWLETAQVAPPNSDRVHSINDAVALVGIRNFQTSLSNYNTSIASLTDQTGERLTQAGFLQPYAGSTAPAGWLLCYGQAVSRTTYSVLFAVIGTTYGAGDGTTTFNIPDLRGRTFAGLDNMGGSDANVLTVAFNPNRNVLGGFVGQESHQLIIAEMPSHTHTYAADNGGSVTTASLLGRGGSPLGNGNTGSTGGDQAHQNVQPSMMGNWLIKI